MTSDEVGVKELREEMGVELSRDARGTRERAHHGGGRAPLDIDYTTHADACKPRTYTILLSGPIDRPESSVTSP